MALSLHIVTSFMFCDQQLFKFKFLLSIMMSFSSSRIMRDLTLPVYRLSSYVNKASTCFHVPRFHSLNPIWTFVGLVRLDMAENNVICSHRHVGTWKQLCRQNGWTYCKFEYNVLSALYREKDAAYVLQQAEDILSTDFRILISIFVLLLFVAIHCQSNTKIM